MYLFSLSVDTSNAYLVGPAVERELLLLGFLQLVRLLFLLVQEVEDSEF